MLFMNAIWYGLNIQRKMFKIQLLFKSEAEKTWDSLVWDWFLQQSAVNYLSVSVSLTKSSKRRAVWGVDENEQWSETYSFRFDALSA